MEPFTFVIDPSGTPTAGQGPDGWEVTEVTNLLTGYCPEASSWPAVARALDRTGLAHPGRFTDEFVFPGRPKGVQAVLQ